jgi:hypothetical protein
MDGRSLEYVDAVLGKNPPSFVQRVLDVLRLFLVALLVGRVEVAPDRGVQIFDPALPFLARCVRGPVSRGLKDGSAVIFAALFAALLFSFAIGFVVGWACKESDWK